MDNLPEDVLLRIFVRFNLRDLLIARQVSKQWSESICSNRLYKMREEWKAPMTPFIVVFDQVTEDPDPPVAERANLVIPSVRSSFYNINSNIWREISSTKSSFDSDHHPGRRSAFCCASVGGKIYLLGGRCWQFDNGLNMYTWKSSSDVFVYCPIQNGWRKVASMNHARASFACAVLGGKIYVAAGSSRALDEQEDEEYLKTDSKSISNSRDVRTVKTGVNIYTNEEGNQFLGQTNLKAESSSREDFQTGLREDQEKEKCEALNLELEPKNPVAATTMKANQRQYDGFHNRFGGRGSSVVPQSQPSVPVSLLGDLQKHDKRFPKALSTAEVYDSMNDTWNLIQSLPEDIYFPDEVSCQGQAVNGEFVVLGRGFGGLDSDGKYIDDKGSVFCYNPEKGRWRKAGPGPGPPFRRGFGTAVLKNMLVLFAGLSMLKPSWGLGGQLMLSRNPPSNHFSLHYFIDAKETLEASEEKNIVGNAGFSFENQREYGLEKSLLGGEQAENKGRGLTTSVSNGRWNVWTKFNPVPSLPKLCPTCVSMDNRLYVVGSQERKMGVWEVFGLWRLSQPMLMFDPNGGEGETWFQLARMPYAPVRPRSVALYL